MPRGRLEKRISLMNVRVTLAAAVGASFSHSSDGIDLLSGGHAAASAQERTFVVLGHPSYTRSIQVLKGRWACRPRFFANSARARTWRECGTGARPPARRELARRSIASVSQHRAAQVMISSSWRRLGSGGCTRFGAHGRTRWCKRQTDLLSQTERTRHP